MTGSVSRRSLLPEGSRLSSSRKRGLRFWRHRGFVLAEALIVLLIVSLGMAMAVPLAFRLAGGAAARSGGRRAGLGHP